MSKNRCQQSSTNEHIFIIRFFLGILEETTNANVRDVEQKQRIEVLMSIDLIESSHFFGKGGGFNLLIFVIYLHHC